jgi:hypothetical protein
MDDRDDDKWWMIRDDDKWWMIRDDTDDAGERMVVYVY